jgi:hypothetical protein
MKFATAPIALVPLVAALPPAMRTVETNFKNATALVIQQLQHSYRMTFLTTPP